MQGVTKNRAVFLDRDGVLDEVKLVDGVPHPPANTDEFRLLPEVVDACRILHQEHFLLIVVTNQPDVARGTQTRETVEAINDLLVQQLPIDDVFVCWHDNADNCDCRKPKPGMLLSASAKWNIGLSESYMIGDRYTDILAGAQAGCKTFLIQPLDKGNYGKVEKCKPDWIMPNLLFAAMLIIHLKEKA